METKAIQSGLEPLLRMGALAEYLDVPVPTIRAGGPTAGVLVASRLY
jgi:hypothetical protein